MAKADLNNDRELHEEIERELAVERDLATVKTCLASDRPDQCPCALSRLVVWLTERALKEDKG